MSDHAISKARAWADLICEAMAALAALEDGDAETVSFNNETFDDADTLRKRIQEMPLSFQVRGGWYSPGGEKPDAEEYEILLSTGRPALRIFGEIDSYPSLQWQDWRTPWTDYNDTTTPQYEAISGFVGLLWLCD